MTGSGTLADPYVIWDVNDLQAMKDNLNAYYELANDIDASRPEWSWASQTRKPISDISSSGTWEVYPAIPTTKWDKVDEEVQDGDSTYIKATTDDARAMFGISSFSIPGDAEDIDLIVTAYFRNDGSAYSRYKFWIRVNGVNYGQPAGGSLLKTPYGYFQGAKEWQTNPATGLAWTIDDINGIGANPLQGIGISCPDATPAVFITQIGAMVLCMGFEPIGKYDAGADFIGGFDGKGHKITNLYINRPMMQFVGLFGFCGDNLAWIRNVGIENCSVTGWDDTGALAGWSGVGLTGKISNCYATGTVTLADLGMGENVDSGGLIGYNGQSVEDCYFSGTISLDTIMAQELGGLIGLNDGALRRCFSEGSFDITIRPGYYSDSIGGLVGDDSGDITQCFSTMDITVVKLVGDDYSLDGIGGLVGISGGGYIYFSDCYSRGDVKVTSEATGDVWDIGGFIGFNDETIDNCYSTGKVEVTASNKSYIGGFCGDNNNVISDCFWDIETSGMLVSAAGTGRTTSQMKTETTFTNAGWNFTNIWLIVFTCNNHYPCLQNVTPLCSASIPQVVTLPATGVT